MPNDYPRCKTCRHWAGNEHSPGAYAYGSCFHPKVMYDSKVWVDCTDGAMQFGMDAGYVTFAPAPDFGCVLHEVNLINCAGIR